MIFPKFGEKKKRAYDGNIISNLGLERLSAMNQVVKLIFSCFSFISSVKSEKDVHKPLAKVFYLSPEAPWSAVARDRFQWPWLDKAINSKFYRASSRAEKKRRRAAALQIRIFARGSQVIFYNFFYHKERRRKNSNSLMSIPAYRANNLNITE